MRIAIKCIAALMGVFAGSLHAMDFCVSTASGLTTALTTATASAGDDTIRITTAPIVLTAPIELEVFGALSILGGYPTGCSGFSSTSAMSQLTIPDKFRLNLTDDDLTLSRLRFNGPSSTVIADFDTVSAARTGLILVQRVAVNAGLDGMLVISNHHDVRIENSLFTGSTRDTGPALTGAGFGFNRSPLASAPISIELINNTSVGNRYGFSFVTSTLTSFVPVMVNNMAFENRQADLLMAYPVVLKSNLWVSESFSNGALPAFGSSNNLHTPAQLDAAFKPIEPSSPLINSGNNTPTGGLPTSDHDGGPRRIGTQVDRGAYESSVNNSVSTFSVTNTNNSGSGSLRQAINDANESSDESAIEFDIGGSCPRIITLTSVLPKVANSTNILGYSQTGSVRNEASYAFDGTLCIALNGSGAVGNGLHFLTQAGESMLVEGIAFYGFTSEALLITGAGNGIVRGNAFGTGANIMEFGFDDAAIRVQDAPGTIIGGSDVASRNVISRATQVGVSLETGTGGREVLGNLIGFNLAGTNAGTNGVGVHVDNSSGDTINHNTIGFSSTHGIMVTGTATPPIDMRIKFNRLGVSAEFGPAGNGGNGARFEAGSFINFNGNSVKYNGTDGVVVLAAARRVNIGANYYAQNALQAIDLSPNGVNPIDLDVDATGANDQQNYPTLTTASGTANIGTVSGNLQSANDTYLIRFFLTDNCDTNGFGEAERYIGETTVTINNAGPSSNGSAPFAASVHSDNVSLLTGVITAIASDSQGNTSETSACALYLQGPQLFVSGFE